MLLLRVVWEDNYLHPMVFCDNHYFPDVTLCGKRISVNGTQLFVNENSIIRDANIAVLAKHKSVVFVTDSKLLDNAKNVVIPATSGVTVMDVTLIGDSVAMIHNTFKPAYAGQPAHAYIPFSGVESHYWVGSIGNSAKKKKCFLLI